MITLPISYETDSPSFRGRVFFITDISAVSNKLISVIILPSKMERIDIHDNLLGTGNIRLDGYTYTEGLQEGVWTADFMIAHGNGIYYKMSGSQTHDSTRTVLDNHSMKVGNSIPADVPIIEVKWDTDANTWGWVTNYYWWNLNVIVDGNTIYSKKEEVGRKGNASGSISYAFSYENLEYEEGMSHELSSQIGCNKDQGDSQLYYTFYPFGK